MKVSLIVGDGVHQGKAIPIAGPLFVIGRDAGCSLRPASPAVSKKHCTIAVRDGKVFVKDEGSTNGTFVNSERIEGEREVNDKDSLAVGPLNFKMQIVRPAAAPPPAAKGRPAKGKAAAAAAGPAPEAADDEVPLSVDTTGEPSRSEQIAALLLGDSGDGSVSVSSDSPGEVPDGTTVMEMKALTASDAEPEKADKAAQVKQAQNDNSAKAAEILKLYRRGRN